MAAGRNNEQWRHLQKLNTGCLGICKSQAELFNLTRFARIQDDEKAMGGGGKSQIFGKGHSHECL